MIVLYEREQVFGHSLSEWGSCKRSFSRALQDIVTILLLARSYFSTKAISYYTVGRVRENFGNHEMLINSLVHYNATHFPFFIALLWAMISFSSTPYLTPCSNSGIPLTISVASTEIVLCISKNQKGLFNPWVYYKFDTRQIYLMSRNNPGPLAANIPIIIMMIIIRGLREEASGESSVMWCANSSDLGN